VRVVATAEARFSRTPDGAVWTVGGPSYPFWTRYLSAFEQVRLVARVQDVGGSEAGATRVDGPQVEVWPVPYYVGLRQYLSIRRAVHRTVLDAADGADAAVLRVPSLISTLLANHLEKRVLPYALEVVGDPAEVFAPGALDHPLRPVLRYWYTTRLQQQCRRADAVSYVTQHSLQARYPARPDARVVNYSSISLPPDAYVPRPRQPTSLPEQITLVSVASLLRLYKGVDTLIEALPLLIARGLAVRLVHVGDGPFRSHLERLAARLRVAERVDFLGALPGGEPIWRQLDAADLFVLPSRTEGLPRALIEAMARGLPAVGTRVGGIPELLPDEDMVPPNDPPALADAIARILADPNQMAAKSERNLTRARDYSAEFLTPRREDFYRSLREAVDRDRPQVGSP
jgi:phosphatidylinositol alpha-1,6-mannosyltransferase